jgi:hypothetical protein
MAEHNFTKAQTEPILTADGKRWCLNCYICNKQIDFFKAPRESWKQIGQYVRHAKCSPPPLK